MTYVYNQRVSRQLPVIILFLLGVLLASALYLLKNKALSAKTELRSLEAQVAMERVTIDVLNAEVAYLESPARISELARHELGMEPLKAQHFITLQDLDGLFPILPSSELMAGADYTRGVGAIGSEVVQSGVVSAGARR